MAKKKQDAERKPRVFVGSSTESVNLAIKIQELLQDEARLTVWKYGLFEPGEVGFVSLLKGLSEFDFGIFLFTPDDIARIRGKQVRVPRDNVVFELGLFIGRIGSDRCFVIEPKAKDSLKLPSDLLGVTTLRFTPSDDDEELGDSLGPACAKIRTRIKNLALHESHRGNSIEAKQELLLGSKATAVLREFELATQRLIVVLNTSTGLTQEGRLGTVFRETHAHAQNIFDELWPTDEIVVTVKTIEPGNPTRLYCHHFFARLPLARQERLRKLNFPETIPLKGSLAGEVFEAGKPIFVTDVPKEPKHFDPNLYETFKGLIGSMVAWPMRIDGTVVAVLKVDSTRSGIFRYDDAELYTILMGIATQFELMFQVFHMKLETLSAE